MVLKYRGEETKDRLGLAVEERPLTPLRYCDFLALLQVVEKDVFHSAVEITVVNEQCTLKIILKAAEVKVN